jgi:hypothetical protein
MQSHALRTWPPSPVVDWTSAEVLLSHWLGNAVAAGIDYYLIAAADHRTAVELGRRRLGDRCFSLEGGRGGGRSVGWAGWRVGWVRQESCKNSLHHQRPICSQL